MNSIDTDKKCFRLNNGCIAYFVTNFLNGGTRAADVATVCARKRFRIIASSSAADNLDAIFETNC